MSDKIRVFDSSDDFQVLTANGVVLVDFFATWCNPCRMQLAILNVVAEKMEDKVSFIKIDTDQFGTLAQQFQVSSIPTLVVFNNGQVVEKFVGLQDENKLTDVLNKYLVY